MMESLVTADWLAEHLEDPAVVILDCSVGFEVDDRGMRPVSGQSTFDEQHIPGAGFADLISDLSDTAQSIGFAVPTPEAFCDAMGRLGVGDETRVVLYDTNMSVWAARVWWMLRWIGFDRAAVLDGGFKSWQASGHRTTSDFDAPSTAVLTPRVRPDLIADRVDVLAAIDDDDVTLVDTLGSDHYSGELAMYARPGHIPSAINVPCWDVLDDEGLLESAGLTVERHGGDPGQRMITYCGGGIAASLNAFALHRAGFDDVAVYTASLQEWAADHALPLVTE